MEVKVTLSPFADIERTLNDIHADLRANLPKVIDWAAERGVEQIRDRANRNLNISPRHRKSWALMKKYKGKKKYTVTIHTSPVLGKVPLYLEFGTRGRNPVIVPRRKSVLKFYWEAAQKVVYTPKVSRHPGNRAYLIYTSTYNVLRKVYPNYIFEQVRRIVEEYEI